MKALLLLRHGKSPHPAGVADHARPLNDSGRKRVRRVAALSGERLPPPDLVLCSTSRRTQETAGIFLEALGRPDTLCLNRQDLYLCYPEAILEAVRETSDDMNTVLVVGHNPSIEDLARMAAGPLPFPVKPGVLIALRNGADTWAETVPAHLSLLDCLDPRKQES